MLPMMTMSEAMSCLLTNHDNHCDQDLSKITLTNNQKCIKFGKHGDTKVLMMGHASYTLYTCR